MKKKWHIHLSLLAIAIIHGANYSIAKEVMPQYAHPYSFVFIRLVFAAILFWICSLFVQQERIAKEHIGLLLLCAASGAAFNQLTFFKGLSIATPIHASLIMITVPIFTILFAAIILKQKVTLYKIIGIALGMIGAAIIILRKGINIDAIGIGELWVMVNSLFYAMYLVLIKKMTIHYHPFTISKWIFTIGVVMVLPFAYNPLIHTNIAVIPYSVWCSILYVLLFTTFLTYMLNAFALVHASPHTVSAYIYLQPLFAAIFALLLHKERLLPITIIAAAMIFVGLYFINKNNTSE